MKTYTLLESPNWQDRIQEIRSIIRRVTDKLNPTDNIWDLSNEQYGALWYLDEVEKTRLWSVWQTLDNMKV
jgi:hypothetical protein